MHMSSFCLVHSLVVLRLCTQHCAAYMSAANMQLHPLIIRMYDTHNTGLCEFYLPTPIHTCGLEVSALADFYAIFNELPCFTTEEFW